MTLVGAIDDATGLVTGATFREQEDAAGYLTVLRETVRRHGIPLAVYHDRHTIFATPAGPLTLEHARGATGNRPPSRATTTMKPAHDHPWRRIDKRSNLYGRLTKSVTT